MDDNSKDTYAENQHSEDSALFEFTVEAISFEQLLSEYESTRPAKEYKPIAVADEAVPVVIYGPGEEIEPEQEIVPVHRVKKSETRIRQLQRPKSIRGAVTVGVFIFIVYLVSIVSILVPDREFSQTENRSLAQRPEISRISIATGSFMSRFEAYLSDQFPARDFIVSVKSRAERLFGKSEQNGVYIGSDGWLFEQQTEYDEQRVSAITDAVNDFSKSCKIKNQMFALVPNSSYILSQYLPKYLHMDNQGEQIKSVYNLLSKNIRKINAASILSAIDTPQYLYYHTDHHWTTRAAKQIFNAISKQWGLNASDVDYDIYTASNSFFGTLASSSGIFDKADKIEICIPRKSAETYIAQNMDLQSKSTSLFDLSKLKNQNQYEVFLSGNYSRIIISTTNRNSKSLLLFKDSYANCLIPMLTPYFEKIVVVDPRYFNEEVEGVLSDENFTHLLYLYNVNTFLEDSSLADVLEISSK